MVRYSRNAWIKKDDPKLVSGKHKDMYEDILSDRRCSSDLCWASRTRLHVPTFERNIPRTPTEIKDHVLKSDRVKYAMEKISQETGRPLSELTAQAVGIVDEMAHNLSLKAIRGFAYFLIKIFKQLYQHVYVNEDGIQQIRALLKHYPILVMPTHRSYMDFLLVSLLFYHYDLPLPAIASAMDFMGMNFFGWLLRNSGAFYIQRSFSNDELYWAVFTEYVQTHMCNGDCPLEFFIEGTRSRTAKSYCPKLGMLSACLEPYFKSRISDIKIIPISISYSRILEESLYACELLGVPKPKESTYGLFKARSILSENYGSIHIHVGEAISVQRYSNGLVDRSQHNLYPRFITSFTRDEQLFCHKLAYHIMLNQLRHLVICPWSMISAVLMQNKEGISTKQLLKEVEWLKRQASNLGAYIDWPGHEPADVVKNTLRIHQNLVRVTKDELVELCSVQKPDSSSSKAANDHMMQTALQHLMLASYRNQMMHIFVRVAMITLSINACPQEVLSLDDLFQKYAFLEKLLSQDFIFLPGSTKPDFDQALLTLTHTCGVVVEDNQIQIKTSTNKYTMFFSQMFEPFLLGYWIVCQHLLSQRSSIDTKPVSKPLQVITKEIQMVTAQLLRDGLIKHFECLSLNMTSNGLQALNQMDILNKEKRNGKIYVTPNVVGLSQVTDEIAKYIEVPVLPFASISMDSKAVVVNAKL